MEGLVIVLAGSGYGTEQVIRGWGALLAQTRPYARGGGTACTDPDAMGRREGRVIAVAGSGYGTEQVIRGWEALLAQTRPYVRAGGTACTDPPVRRGAVHGGESHRPARTRMTGL
jgi:acetoin utilization deacetylase AcuC-like enzyme